MKLSQVASSLLAAACAVTAQQWSAFTDDNGIKFWQVTVNTGVGEGGSQWGMALPGVEQEVGADEYIGRFAVTKPDSGTWFGISHTSGMVSSLLLMVWENEGEVMTSFRYADGYVAPDVYTGNASLAVIDSNVNDTHIELTYRCTECWRWDQDGEAGNQLPATTTNAVQIMGWAQATQAPTNPGEQDTGMQQHEKQGIFAGAVASARNTAYTDWTALASATSPTGPTGTASATATATAACATTGAVGNQTFDYIVVGAGAGGIPLADKLSESGASVLLIEKGPPSSGRWGGTMKPEWLEGTNLTRFDVPGLDNQIWKDSDGIACTDVGVMAGCVLGGGTAVNAGLWWKPNPDDFNLNFPNGWKDGDMRGPVERAFTRIPFTEHPSMDGKIYKPEGYKVVAGALAASGWHNITADERPSEKNLTFSRPNHMFNNGERSGPMATYLVTASERDNFRLVTNTSVTRVVRDGSRITGVEVEAFLSGGQCGTINVTPGSGKVILSAGAFGSPKILMRSGIGPQDQLEIVQSAENDKMIDSSEWIDLPVGYNLDDHTNTNIVITHPNVSSYDWYAAYDDPIPADRDAYLDHRSGILAQSAPNLAVIAWHEIEGADGIRRQLQYTARVEASEDIESPKAMTISQYLGRGAVSRGRATITRALNMVVSKVPYLHDENDLAVVAAGIDAIKKSLSADRAIQIVFPPANQTTKEFLASYPLTTSKRSANHFIGTCKMGESNDESAVVDVDTKVIGTDNLFVVDGSIMPGMVTSNPSAVIVSVAERAAERILALSPTRVIARSPRRPPIAPPWYTGANSTPPWFNGSATATVLPSGSGIAFPSGSGRPRPAS